MVLTVLTAAFLVVDLPLMAQMGGQQQGRGQQGAPQQKGAQQSAPQQKGAQQGAPKGAGQAQIGKPPEPKLSPPQKQRVRQLRQQAQSLFRNLRQVLDQFQVQGMRVTKNTDKSFPPMLPGKSPNEPIPPVELSLPENQGAKGLGATSNPSEGVIEDDPHTVITPDGTRKEQKVELDGNRLAQTGRNNAAFIKFDGLKKQAQQIVNNLEGIGKELKGLGFTRNDQILTKQADPVIDFTPTVTQDPTLLPFPLPFPQQLQQMVKELEKYGVVWPEY